MIIVEILKMEVNVIILGIEVIKVIRSADQDQWKQKYLWSTTKVLVNYNLAEFIQFSLKI